MWVAICGKALAGYNKPHKKVIPPTVKSFIIDDATAELYVLFAETLFRNVRLEFFDTGGLLVEFRDGMIAAFLKDLPSFVELAPQDDPVLVHVLKCAKDCDIAYEVLVRWGEAVKLQWDAENAAEQAGDDVNAEALKAMAATIVSLSRNVLDLKEQSARTDAHNKATAAHNKAMALQMNRMEAQQADMFNLFKKQ